jgi:putative FmdB family regulatory protein
MPTYVYRCTKCNHQFEMVMTVAEHDSKRPVCPKCGSRKTEHRFSGFFAVTSRKS